MSDPRFSRLRSDPRFRRPKKAKSKVVVDERFKSVFAQEKKPKINPLYGRPLSATHEQDNLRRFYRIEDEDETPDEPKLPDYARGQVLLESSDEEEPSKVQDDSDESDFDGFVSVGRGEHSDAEIDLDESQTAELTAQAAAYSQEHPQIEEGDKTRRVAVVNLDWDHVRAAHLYKICSSLVSPTAPSSRATTSSRKATTSQRMAREEKEGPPAELFKTKSDSKEVNEKTIYEVGDENQVNEEALRKYQLERLRYYYAVIECDSVDTASHIYDELEGTELERSANVFDLSFIPDDMTFDNPFRDEATEETGTQTKSLDFVTDALRHSKVKLTWDEDDPERNQVTRRTFTKKEIEEDNFQTYLASSSSDSEQDEDRPKKGDRKAQSRDKLRALLLGGNDAMPEGWARDEEGGDAGSDVDMEITFTPAFPSRKEAEGRTEERWPTKEKDEDWKATTSSMRTVKRNLLKASETKKADKEKERNHQDLSHLVDEEDDGKHFDLKAILKAEKKSKRKGKKKSKDAAPTDETQPDFFIDVADSRFSVLHEDPTFAIDPSNPQFKKTKSMSALLEEGGKRRQKKRGEDGIATTPTSSTGSGRKLESLVESVKRKSMVQGQKGNGKRQKIV
ncbi:hypothetical protein CPB85DRAFT_1427899 [Mucidula mucida]|nr:hypothetical protein CPB85DRAFT_1427899 [Mucidula mucida]